MDIIFFVKMAESQLHITSSKMLLEYIKKIIDDFMSSHTSKEEIQKYIEQLEEQTKELKVLKEYEMFAQHKIKELENKLLLLEESSKKEIMQIKQQNIDILEDSIRQSRLIAKQVNECQSNKEEIKKLKYELSKSQMKHLEVPLAPVMSSSFAPVVDPAPVSTFAFSSRLSYPVETFNSSIKTDGMPYKRFREDEPDAKPLNAYTRLCRMINCSGNCHYAHNLIEIKLCNYGAHCSSHKAVCKNHLHTEAERQFHIDKMIKNCLIERSCKSYDIDGKCSNPNCNFLHLGKY